MNKDEAYRSLVDAQSDVLDVLRSQSELHGKRLNDLSGAIDALARMIETQSELISTLQAGYDTKIAMIVEHVDSLVTRES
jgi:hypothetical protein